jgi:hypothetical protein
MELNVTAQTPLLQLVFQLRMEDAVCLAREILLSFVEEVTG